MRSSLALLPLDRATSTLPTAHSGTLYNLFAHSASSSVVGKTYAAAVDCAAQYLPAPLSTRRRAAGPPPALVCIRPQRGDDVYVPIPVETSLQELRAICTRETGIPPASVRLFVEEEQRPEGGGGLVSALRSTAGQLGSRERVRDAVVEWVNFVFLPEAVNREVRGRGVVSWARERVWPRLHGPPPLHVAHAWVLLRGGRRALVELSATATLQRLREAVERQTGLAPERQRLVATEPAAEGPVQAAFWAAARLCFVLLCAAAGAAAGLARWLVLGAEPDQTIVLKLQPEGGGKAVDMSVRRDVTLGQLQHLVQLQHGDSVNLQGVVLGGGSASGGGGGGGGGMIAAST
jgi:hypothetical protein